MNRGTFLLGGAGLVAAGGATPIATQFLWIKNVEYAGFFVADAKGYYRSAGIAPNFLAGGPNLASVEAIVAGGRADVGVDDIEKITDGIAQGVDLVVFGAIYQHSVGGILSLPRAPIRTPADLVGKRLGLQQGGKAYIDAILSVNKLPLRYTEVPVGFDPDPLVAGACDGYLCYITNQPLMLAQRHVPYVVVSLEALGFPMYSGCLFATRATLAAQRPALVRYLRATARGWADNMREPAYGATLAVKTYGANLGLDLQQQTQQNQAQIPLMESDLTRRNGGPLWVSTAEIRGGVYRALRAAGRRNLPDVDRLVDLSLLRDAYAGR